MSMMGKSLPGVQPRCFIVVQTGRWGRCHRGCNECLRLRGV